MKNLITFLIIGVCLPAFPQPDCSLDLKTIYDFQIGDVFQTKRVNDSWIDGVDISERIEKYTIVDKIINSDTLKYARNGISRLHQYNLNPLTEEIYDYGTTISYINDTIVIIDSLRHYLNSCINDTVIIQSAYEFLTRHEFYTVVDITDENSFFSKRFGGDNNLFWLNESDSLINDQENVFELKYASNLGLIYSWEFNHEHGSQFELQGYVKDGDTTGVITRDQELITSIYSQEIQENILLFPTVVSGNKNVTILNCPTNSKLQVISLNGKVYKNTNLIEDKFSLLDLKSGVYIIRVTKDDFEFNKKIIIL